MYEDKSLIIFDLDGTLANSKTEMDEEMSALLNQLLQNKQVAVISGGAYLQYEKQFLKSLSVDNSVLSNLYLFPTCSTSFYRFGENRWIQVYYEFIPAKPRKSIIEAFEKTFKETEYRRPERVWGEVIEDRETQITMSALGQLAPYEEKCKWDPDQNKRRKLIKHLSKYLPKGYEARLGGSTSIDVTKVGVNKGYGIQRIKEILGIGIKEMLFIGDALYEGGNDYPVKESGVDCLPVEGPEDTKKIIREILI